MAVGVDVGEPDLVAPEQAQVEHLHVVGGADYLRVARLAPDEAPHQLAHDERVQMALNLVAHERLVLLEDVHDRAHEPDELLRSHRLFHEVKGKIFVYRLYRRGHDRLVQEHRLEGLRHVGRKLRGGHKPLLALRLDVHDVASRVLHEFEEHVLYRPVMLHLARGVFKPVVVVVHQHHKPLAVEKIGVHQLLVVQVVHGKAQHQLVRRKLFLAERLYAAEFFAHLDFVAVADEYRTHPAVRRVEKAFLEDMPGIIRKTVLVPSFFPYKFHGICRGLVMAETVRRIRQQRSGLEHVARSHHVLHERDSRKDARLAGGVRAVNRAGGIHALAAGIDEILFKRVVRVRPKVERNLVADAPHVGAGKFQKHGNSLHGVLYSSRPSQTLATGTHQRYQRGLTDVSNRVLPMLATPLYRR